MMLGISAFRDFQLGGKEFSEKLSSFVPFLNQASSRELTASI